MHSAPSFQIAERANRDGSACGVQRVNTQVDHLIRFKSFYRFGEKSPLENLEISALDN
jgi:hypothetical protein